MKLGLSEKKQNTNTAVGPPKRIEAKGFYRNRPPKGDRSEGFSIKIRIFTSIWVGFIGSNILLLGNPVGINWNYKKWKTIHLNKFWTEKYWNTNPFDNLWSMTGGRVGRAAGSGDWNICERIHFGNMYPEKTEYCIYHWILTFWYFYKKGARRKITKIGPTNAPRSLIWDPIRPN